MDTFDPIHLIGNLVSPALFPGTWSPEWKAKWRLWPPRSMRWQRRSIVGIRKLSWRKPGKGKKTLILFRNQGLLRVRKHFNARLISTGVRPSLRMIDFSHVFSLVRRISNPWIKNEDCLRAFRAKKGLVGIGELIRFPITTNYAALCSVLPLVIFPPMSQRVIALSFLR